MTRNKITIEYSLLVKILNDLATEVELKEYRRWYSSSKKNQVYFKKLKANYGKNDVFTQQDIEKLWHAINKSTSPKRITLFKMTQYAAAILLPVLLVYGVLYLSDTEKQQVSQEIPIKSAIKKATIVLSDGSTQELDKEGKGSIIEDNGLVVGKDSLSTLIYDDIIVDKLVYNTIMVPHAGEYELILSDGTQVWLNSGSSLKYPVNFIGNKREVILTGEGYFDVSHNANKPFIVKTDHTQVKVYGTKFNVMGYSDEKEEQVTLVEGKVGIIVDYQESLLDPGEQASILTATGDVEINEVNTSLYTGWVEGELRFRKMPLNQLAKKLSRWYDVDFFFANSSVVQKTFTGKVDKGCDFELFMGLIEKTTNVNITIDGRTVLINETK